jgi:tight adherence protein C
VTAVVAASLAALAVLVLPRPGPPPRASTLLGHRRAGVRWSAPGQRVDRWLAPTGAPPPDEASARRTTIALGLAVVAVPIVPQALPAVLAWRWAAPRLASARRARRQASAVTETLPDVIDLLRLANGAGLALPLALPLVARRSAGVLADAFSQVDRRVAAGQARADALLAGLEPLGDDAAALGHLLADHLRHGTPLGPALDRLAFEARTARRHRAEQAARRVPVRLLLPLVACILPAFGLLTVVPLLAGSLRTLAG